VPEPTPRRTAPTHVPYTTLFRSTVVCGDSHTSTHGAFGAMAFGIGTSEGEHVMATQTLPLKPFKTMAITVEGELRDGVTAKDIRSEEHTSELQSRENIVPRLPLA